MLSLWLSYADLLLSEGYFVIDHYIIITVIDIIVIICTTCLMYYYIWKKTAQQALLFFFKHLQFFIDYHINLCRTLQKTFRR